MYKHYNTDTALCINSRNVGSGTACVVIPVLGLILVSFTATCTYYSLGIRPLHMHMPILFAYRTRVCSILVRLLFCSLMAVLLEPKLFLHTKHFSLRGCLKTSALIHL